MIHAAESGGWTRRYEYSSISNRLLGTSVPGDHDDECSARYQYDAHGNMIRMPHLPLMQWDERDQLRATSQQVVNEGTPETTWYVYDGAGQRVRKVTERQSGARTSASTWSGCEIYRDYEAGAVSLERETLHIMDGQQRIALVETRTQGSDGSPTQLISLPVRQPPRFGQPGAGCGCADHLLRRILPAWQHLLPGRAQHQRSQPEALPLHRQGARRGDRAGLPRGAVLRLLVGAVDGGGSGGVGGWGQCMYVLERKSDPLWRCRRQASRSYRYPEDQQTVLPTRRLQRETPSYHSRHSYDGSER